MKLKEGLTFLGARPSNPTQWMVSQDVRSEGHRVVTLHCRRKEAGYDQQRSAQLPGRACFSNVLRLRGYVHRSDERQTHDKLRLNVRQFHVHLPRLHRSARIHHYIQMNMNDLQTLIFILSLHVFHMRRRRCRT